MPKPKINLSWKEYHKAMQETGNVKRALRDDPEYKKWYNKHRR